jgi:UDP-glucose 4-epimerase
VSPYAVSKLAGESYCRAFAAVYGLESIALRYFNVFGPRQDPTSQYSAVIPRFITAARSGRPVTVYGDGSQSRDFTFIDNVVHANLCALTAARAEGQALNIACGERISLLEVIGVLGDLLQQDVEVDHAPPRAGEIPHSLADVSRAASEIGYVPAIGFRDGLARTIESFAAASAPAAAR